MLVDDISILIDEIFCRPIFVIVGIPGSEIIIECNRIFYTSLLDCFFYIFRKFFKGKLRSMNTEYDESIFFIFLMPSIEIWLGADTVNARISPEIHEHYPASE